MKTNSIHVVPECQTEPISNEYPSSSSILGGKQSFPGAKVLFVDGDNTIRRHPDGDSPEGAMAFEEALRRPALADVFVVACGQWKEVLSLDRLRAIFSHDIAARIVDRTPDLEEDGSGFKTHREIFSWLEAHPEIAKDSFLGPFYGLEPHLENGVFISDGLVFGEDPRHVSFLERMFAPGAFSSS